MTVGFNRLLAGGTGFALAAVVATALTAPTSALAAAEQATVNPSVVTTAPTTTQNAGEQRSLVVKSGTSAVTTNVRHYYPPLLDDGRLNPSVRHYYP